MDWTFLADEYISAPAGKLVRAELYQGASTEPYATLALTEGPAGQYTGSVTLSPTPPNSITNSDTWDFAVRVVETQDDAGWDAAAVYDPDTQAGPIFDRSFYSYIVNQAWEDIFTESTGNLSYNTVTEADAYFAMRLHAELWTQATNATKQAALHEGYLIINKFSYIGVKADPAQDGEWPRTGVWLNCVEIVGVPAEIKIAECDIAYALLSGVNPDSEMRAASITSRGYSSVRITYDPKLIQEWLTYGVPSQSAWANLAPFLERESSGSIKLHRVS